MSVPPARLLETEAELKSVITRIFSLEDQKRLLEASQTEFDQAPQGQLWQGVGRAYFQTTAEKHKAATAKQLAALTEQIDALQKKKTYFSTTLDKMLGELSTQEQQRSQ